VEMLRRRGDAGEREPAETSLDSLLSEPGPLDKHEQEEVVATFQQQQFSLLRQWRYSFAALSLTLASLFCHHALSQARHPWDLKCTAQFSRILPAPVVAFGFAFSAVPLLAMAVGIVMGSKRDRGLVDSAYDADDDPGLAAGCGVLISPQTRSLALWASVGMAAFWALADAFSDGLFRWQCSWVSVAPLGFCVAQLYIEGMADASLKDVKRLRRMMYEYSKL